MSGIVRLLTEFRHVNGSVRLVEYRRADEVFYLVDSPTTGQNYLTPNLDHAKAQYQALVAAVPVFIGYGSYGCALPPLVADCAERDILHISDDLIQVGADIGHIASELAAAYTVSAEGAAEGARRRHQELQGPLCRLIGALLELDTMGGEGDAR